MNVYPPGSLIASRFLVVSPPMEGGMGVVYFCIDKLEDYPVALKTFKSEYLPDRASRDRFLREGNTWMEIGVHPHVVRCIMILPPIFSLETFLVLELVTAKPGMANASLRAWLTRGRSLPVEQALAFAIQIARGMKHAEATISGFVHRDLKPGNVLVGADELPNWDVNRLRVTDFGLATFRESLGPLPETDSDDNQKIRRTHLTHGVVGTPPYMAPEQWKGEKVGVYTDVYALGCIMIEMLSGYPAVEGVTRAELEEKHLAGRLRALPVNLPSSVQNVVKQCTARSPSARQQNWGLVERGLVEAYRAVTRQEAPSIPEKNWIGFEDRVAIGWSYNSIGISYSRIGKNELARKYFERALEIGQTKKDQALEASALGNLGIAYQELNEYRPAITYQEQSLEIKRIISDQQGEANSLANLGNAYVSLGDYTRAIDYYKQALGIMRQIEDQIGESGILIGMGEIYRNIGEYQRAIECYEQSLAIKRTISDRHGEGLILTTLGGVYRQLGEYQRSIEYGKQALAIMSEIGDRGGEGRALGFMGLIYSSLGESQRAIEYLEQALAVTREVGDRQGESDTLGNLGSIYGLLGESQHAIKHLEQALAIAAAIGYRMGEARITLNLAWLHARQDDIALAVSLAQQAGALYRQLGHKEAAHSANELVEILQEGDAEDVSVNDPRQMISAAMNAFLQANSLNAMHQVVDQHPFLIDPYIIAAFDQGFRKHVAPERQSAFEQRLVWLRQIAKGE